MFTGNRHESRWFGSYGHMVRSTRHYIDARRCAAVALSMSLIALLAAMPTASAIAGSSATPAQATGSLPVPLTLNLPAGELESILSSLPIGSLGLTEAELGKVVSEVSTKANPLLGGLAGEITGVLNSLLKSNPQATLNELVSNVNGLLSILLGKSVTPGQILEALNPTQLTKAVEGLLNPEGIVKLLSGLTGKLGELGAAEALSLQGILTVMTSALSPTALSQLQSDVQKLLEGVGKSGSQPILETLKGTLTGSGLVQLEKVLKDLELGSAALQEDLKALLGALNPAELSALLGAAFGALSNPAQLEAIVKGLVGGLGSLTSTKTPVELAQIAGTTVDNLAKELGTTTSSLPETLPAVTALLGKEGPLVSLIDDLGKLTLLGGSSSGTGGAGGSGGQGGGSGGSGQSGSGGSGSGLTVVVNVPAAQPTTSSPPTVATKATTKKTTAKIKIISRKVKGKVATIVLQVPAAGRLMLSGKGVKSTVRNVLGAQRITLKVKLAKAGITSLHRHHNHLKVQLKASFKPTNGAGSTATTSVTFH
jgi:hypothetical protein